MTPRFVARNSPELGDDAAVVTRGENNMVLLDAVGRWDADTDTVGADRNETLVFVHFSAKGASISIISVAIM